MRHRTNDDFCTESRAKKNLWKEIRQKSCLTFKQMKNWNWDLKWAINRSHSRFGYFFYFEIARHNFFICLSLFVFHFRLDDKKRLIYKDYSRHCWGLLLDFDVALQWWDEIQFSTDEDKRLWDGKKVIIKRGKYFT